MSELNKGEGGSWLSAGIEIVYTVFKIRLYPKM